MENLRGMLEKYARLVANVGINVQKGQTVVLNTSTEQMELARLITKECWLAGAGNVFTLINDDACDRMKYEYGETESISKVHNWQVEQRTAYPAGEACFIRIDGDDPDLFAGIDGNKIGTVLNARKHAFAPYYEMINKKENQWCIVAAATPAWAKKIFPDKTEQDAVDALWDAIFTCMRLYDNDPVEAWDIHSKNLFDNCEFMNNSGVVSLHFSNSLGTDIEIGLADGNIWDGGCGYLVNGVSYQANMPTEEVFSMPHRDKVNGKVVSALPLSYQGTLIENFSFTFKDGEVVDYTAEKGKDALDMMLAADPGCKRLGEVALVPYSSPIRESGILFFNTLFDENASCHLALGSAYPDTMKDWAELSPEERTKRGYNKSVSHVDFMFGTADLLVVGTRADGSKVDIFRNGEWAVK